MIISGSMSLKKLAKHVPCQLNIVFTFGDLSLASLMQQIDGLGLAD
jgi:hypothetical protein